MRDNLDWNGGRASSSAAAAERKSAIKSKGTDCYVFHSSAASALRAANGWSHHLYAGSGKKWRRHEPKMPFKGREGCESERDNHHNGHCDGVTGRHSTLG